jgi:large subunit ribosomal protein L4
LLVEAFAVKEPKTKQFLALVDETGAKARKTLIVGASFDEKTYLAARNVKDTLLARAVEVNTEQLLAFEKVIVTKDALATLSERLA